MYLLDKRTFGNENIRILYIENIGEESIGNKVLFSDGKENT
jgi:hypothetical protein